MEWKLSDDRETLEHLMSDLIARPPEGSHEVRLVFYTLVGIAIRAMERVDRLEARLDDLRPQAAQVSE